MINEHYTERQVLTGAEALLGAAVLAGAQVCFANPGTTEMPLVAALDSVTGIRAVLGLHENVCTGAADGYARMTGRPAMTLLHLGPGLANGLSNLHNARRAHSPVVNVVGDHASWHLPADPPLASDIAALAGTVGAYHQVRDRTAIASATRDAIRAAIERRGVSTLVVPADFLLEPARDCPCAEPQGQITLGSVGGDRIEAAARQLREAGPRGVLLLGGAGLTRQGQRAAGKISAATGAALYSETFPARAERGGGLPAIDRLPYFPEAAIDKLRDANAVILAGAAEPVAYFGYPGTPSQLAPDRTVYQLAGPGDDAEQALSASADVLGGPGAVPRPGQAAEIFPAAAALTAESVGSALASWLPENAIVSIEGGTCGYPFYTASAGAAP
ncbi:MAG TPA: acetolactate synthase large subunit, partial [Streptosporangiaceae bacterium]